MFLLYVCIWRSCCSEFEQHERKDSPTSVPYYGTEVGKSSHSSCLWKQSGDQTASKDTQKYQFIFMIEYHWIWVHLNSDLARTDSDSVRTADYPSRPRSIRASSEFIWTLIKNCRRLLLSKSATVLNLSSSELELGSDRPRSARITSYPNRIRVCPSQI